MPALSGSSRDALDSLERVYTSTRERYSGKIPTQSAGRITNRSRQERGQRQNVVSHPPPPPPPPEIRIATDHMIGSNSAAGLDAHYTPIIAEIADVEPEKGKADSQLTMSYYENRYPGLGKSVCQGLEDNLGHHLFEIPFPDFSGQNLNGKTLRTEDVRLISKFLADSYQRVCNSRDPPITDHDTLLFRK